MRSEKIRPVTALVGLAFILGYTALPAQAAISQAIMFRNVQFAQNGNGNTLSFDSAYFTLRMLASNADEYTTVLGFYGGPASPVTLTQTDSTTYNFNPDFYNTKEAMDSDFPAGTYSITANNEITDDHATTMFDYSTDAYPLSQPYLTGTNYSDLQGMNPATPFNFQFSPFIPDAQTTDPELFFTIFDGDTDNSVFEMISYPFTTTGLTLPANTLLPNHTYRYELDFSDRLTTTSNGADNPALLVFDYHTDATFTTGVPELATTTLLAAAALLVRRRRA